MTLGSKIPDKELLKNVLRRMTQKGTSSSRVTATVSGGDATIAGTVAYEYERHAILRSVASVQGIRRVIDQLRVVPKQRPQN